MQCLRIVFFLCCVAFAYGDSESDGCQAPTEDPLHLTPYLDRNDGDTARRLSVVDNSNSYVSNFSSTSHAGFLTVDKELGNHLFFWFFPSTNESAPLVLWLPGGPATSSLRELFYQHGPIDFDSKNSAFTRRQHTWSGPFSMLYVDSTVGVGYSYSDSGHNGVKNTEELYTDDLYHFLQQFLRLFPEYTDREIYIGGQGYASMSVISLAHRIHLDEDHFPIAGIYLSDPYFDIQRQANMSIEFQHSIGRVSYVTVLEVKQNISELFKNYASGEIVSTTELMLTIFGYTCDDNFLTDSADYVGFTWTLADKMNNTNCVRRALHVGNRTFEIMRRDIRDSFGSDAYTSRKDKLKVLMDNYKVLIYGSNLNSKLPAAGVDAVLKDTPWKYQQQYNTTDRKTWPKNDNEVFYSQTGQFCRVVINGAGLQSSHDKPETALEVMKQFVHHGCMTE